MKTLNRKVAWARATGVLAVERVKAVSNVGLGGGRGRWRERTLDEEGVRGPGARWIWEGVGRSLAGRF